MRQSECTCCTNVLYERVVRTDILFVARLDRRKLRRTESSVLPSAYYQVQLLGATMCEGITGDDGNDECLHAVAILSDLLHQFIHHNLVIAFQSST
jgi:hypothetical protein